MISKCARTLASFLTAISLTLSVPGGLSAQPRPSDADGYATKTPIKHVVVIFEENVSFDHYFATYPWAKNTTAGEPKFEPKPDTPRVNNLLSGGLLTDNPNTVQPFRLSRGEAVTCDENHNYLNEQEAVDHGLVDNYVSATGSGDGTIPAASSTVTLHLGTLGGATGAPLQPGQYYTTQVTGAPTGTFSYTGYCFDAGTGKTPNKGLVMGYFDGNTVTAMWNYAQNFALGDNSWSTTFGPSAPGAINLVSGTTSGATMIPLRPNGKASSPSGLIWGGQASVPATSGTLIGDARPAYDDCVTTNGQLANTNQVSMSGTSVGDLMGDLENAGKGITWGWFMGGFAPTNGSSLPAVCGSAGTGLAGFGAGGLPDNLTTVGDYIPHHEPFEFYKSTSNPHHLPPSKPDMIGKTDQANHQYDLSQFFVALKDGSMPAVSFLKAAAYQDAHPEYSDPLDEQTFVVNTINTIMASPEWNETAIIIAYDDSDGWYDHTMDPVVNQSGPTTAVPVDYDDALSSQTVPPSPALPFGACGVTPTTGPTADIPGLCGYGQRQPLLVISPWAKKNYVEHKITDQSSILRFIEDTFDLGRIGGPSSDYKAGRLDSMFDFNDQDSRDRGYRGDDRTLFLNPSTGEVVDLGGK
jgi:phospholipase C